MTKSKLWKIFIHKDTFLLIVTIFLLWFTITLSISQVTKLEALKVHTGVISDAKIVITKIKNKPLFKDTTREMRLFLDQEKAYYSVTSNTDFNYLDSLFVGDTVNIYTKDKSWGIFGFDKRLILQLERFPDGRIFINYTDKQNSNKGLNILTGVATFSFLFWYIKKVRLRTA